MGIAPLTFTGVSQYSQDFQTLLSNAVSVASIPLKQLQNEDSDTVSKEGLLGTMQGVVGDLATSISNLGTVAGNAALGATSSDPSTVSATVSGAATPGIYTISNITSLAGAASETSNNVYADPSSTPVSLNGSMELAVGSQTYDFTLTNNTLDGLRDQINGLNAGVTASIITTDAGSYLTVTANSTGATTLSLTDDPGTGTHQNVQWLTNTNQGSNASFLLNGKQVTSSTNAVTSAVPGVTINLLGTTTGAQPITLTLASDPTQLSNALQNLVTQYNAAVDEMNKHVGPNADLLLADESVIGIQAAMRQITEYRTTGSGAVNSLMDLGISLDSTGKMSFDANAFAALPASTISDACAFLGSATTGFGGMASQLTAYSDPTTGIIATEQTGLQQEDQSLQQQMSDMTDRINIMQTALQSRLEAADSALAQLESQQQMLTASIQSLDMATFGYQQNSSSGSSS